MCSSDLLGLQVNTVAGDAVPADDSRLLTVESATPLGLLDTGTVVTLTYFTQEAELPSPTPTPTE